MTVAMTGAGGFLGWHTRAYLHSIGERDVKSFPVGEAFELDTAASAVSGADKLILLAGVNRGTDDEVHKGNIIFAEQTARVLRTVLSPPKLVVFANSSQAGNGSVYGRAKEQSSEIVRIAAEEVGARFVDLRLPNLFGEHGRPFYNSVTATFCHLLSRDDAPTVDTDRQLDLLHAQHAAEALVSGQTTQDLDAHIHSINVSSLLHVLKRFAETYRIGDVPQFESAFERDLFNTYRSFTFEQDHVLPLKQNTDPRGSFTEVIRTHGSSAQISFSTTVPGVTRGQHYHRRKMERFTVLSGEGLIRLRKLFSDEIVEIPVQGNTPVSVDMPTFWSHSITNTGTDTLVTMFWSNELFDPSNPDTITEPV